jgi:ATP-dependent helicase/nuclease subunit A
MTRAEEALFVGGALGKRDKVPASASWYARLAELFEDKDWLEDPIWGGRADYGAMPPSPHGPPKRSPSTWRKPCPDGPVAPRRVSRAAAPVGALCSG